MKKDWAIFLKIWDSVKKHQRIVMRVVTYVATLVVMFLVYLLFRGVLASSPDLAGLPYSVTKAIFAVFTLKLVDDLLLNEVPTYERLKHEPIGYAIYVHGYALVIALSFI